MTKQKFDKDTALKIQNGDIQGRIVTDHGENVQIFDGQLRGELPVYGIIKYNEYDAIMQWTNDGKRNLPRLNTSSIYDLHIEIDE